MEDHGRKLKIQKESYAPLMVCIYQDAFQLITEDVFITILDNAYEITPAILK